MNDRKRNKLIVGSAIGLATILAAIDHTRHRLPPVEPADTQQEQHLSGEHPCSLAAPCNLSSSPCSLESSPCSLKNPCALGTAPCSL